METLDILSRITHVSTAIVLVGGSTFVLLVLMPAARALSADAHDALAAAINGRWKRFVHGGITLFLLSGFYNYVRAMPLHKGDGPWHAMMGVKMLLAFVVFFLAASLVGRGRLTERFRNARKTWLSVVVVLAAVIVAISGYLKVTG